MSWVALSAHFYSTGTSESILYLGTSIFSSNPLQKNSVFIVVFLVYPAGICHTK